MNRALVDGCIGVGKSAFLKKSVQNTGLPLIFLDQLFITFGYRSAHTGWP